MNVITANHYTFEQLTEAYNQTRVDYLVPMPMNVARLKEYAHVYDIDLACSFVALEETNMLGLGMLGVRDGRTWITRLGVLPSGRRRGVGLNLMEALKNQRNAVSMPSGWKSSLATPQPTNYFAKQVLSRPVI